MGGRRDRDFPAAIYVFALSQAVCWCPYFLHLLLSPWLSSPLPPALAVSMTLLGYAQCALTPLLVLILVERVQRRVLRCTC